MSRDGRRRNAAQVPICEICRDAIVWTSRVRGHLICRSCEPRWKERQQRAREAAADLRETELRERGHEPEALENPLSPGPEWEELDGVQQAISDGLDIEELWRRVGAGDSSYAVGLLSDHWDLDDDVKDVTVIAVPDDMLGDFYRIWIR